MSAPCACPMAVPDPGRARHYGAIGRADGRRALVLRDLVQRRLGVEFGIGAIVVGAAHFGRARAAVACARLGGSVSAFGICRLRRLYAACAPAAGAAVVASSVVGLVVDSIVFLWLAFGSLDFLLGQIVGKAWMVLLAIPFVALLAPPR